MTALSLPDLCMERQSQPVQFFCFEQDCKHQITRFSGHIMAFKSLKKSTINIYCKMVRQFLILKQTIRPTHAQIQDHIISMNLSGYSTYYIRNVIVAIETYMEFMQNPIKLGRPKRPKRTIKETLTEAEISVILASTKNIREKAIIAVLAYSGARNREICNLRVSDVDFGSNNLCIVDGKGSKSRVISISGECTRLLLNYLAQYPRQGNDYLFTTLRKGKGYTTWSLRRLVSTVVGRTFINKRVYPHLFRHSLASNMLGRGANLFTIKQQLGHQFIETTMIYI